MSAASGLAMALLAAALPGVVPARAQESAAFGGALAGGRSAPSAGFAPGLFGGRPGDAFAHVPAAAGKPAHRSTVRAPAEAEVPAVERRPVEARSAAASPSVLPPSIAAPAPRPAGRSLAGGLFDAGLIGVAEAQTLPRPGSSAPSVPGPGAAVPPAPATPGGARAPARGGGRDLTPAEIAALQTLLVNRAAGAMLTPGNADSIRRAMQDAQRMLPAAGTLDTVHPRPRRIDVDPQVLLAEPLSLQLALGVVTPITFLDSAGRPWPVEAVAFDPRMLAQDGNGCGATVPQAAVVGAGARPSTITMMPCRINTFGNVSIKLEGYALPVVLMAKSGGDEAIDLPVTVTVRGRSPAAPMEAADPVGTAPLRVASRSADGPRVRRGSGLPDRFLDTFAAGAPPANAQRVSTDDPAVTGWLLEGRLYLRGAVTVINPAQSAVAEGTGGIKVWRFDRPVPRILVQDESGAERDLKVTF